MGSGFTTRDLFSYGGFIAGIAVFMVATAGVWDVHHLIRLAAGVVVGLICGWIGDRIYTNLIAAPPTEDPPRDDFEDDRFGR
jgi:hypothetical protein